MIVACEQVRKAIPSRHSATRPPASKSRVSTRQSALRNRDSLSSAILDRWHPPAPPH